MSEDIQKLRDRLDILEEEHSVLKLMLTKLLLGEEVEMVADIEFIPDGTLDSIN